MRDDTGAPPVIPVGSRLGTTPASTGGLATPLAPDHHVSAARSAAVLCHDRLCAAHQAPGSDRPSDEPPCSPEQDRPRAASWAPDQHVPVTPTVAAPGVDRLCATHLAPGPAPRQDRPRAGQAPALATPDSRVTPPAPPAPDCSRRDAPGTEPRPTSITDTPAPDLYTPAFTAQERQLLAHAENDPPLAAEIRLLRVLMLRLLTTPRRRRRRAGAAFQRRRRYARQKALPAVCRALDRLQRLLQTQHALAPSASTELMQLLDAAAAHMAAEQSAPADPPAAPSAPADPPAEPPTYAPFGPPTDPPLEPSPDVPPATPPPQDDRPSKYPHAMIPPEPLDPPRSLLLTRSLLYPHEYDP